MPARPRPRWRRRTLLLEPLEDRLLLADPSPGAGVIDHHDTDLTSLSEQAMQLAKDTLHIVLFHTSHGYQTVYGMDGLVDFANGGGLGLTLPTDFFAYNNGGTGGALDLDNISGTHAGEYPEWVDEMRAYLTNPAHADVNVAMVTFDHYLYLYSEEDLNATYFDPMAQLEEDYPQVTFVYATGPMNHGHDAPLKQNNQRIRDYVLAHHKVLYDCADIESYDPDGTYFEFANDNCDYYESAEASDPLGNWAVQWQESHTENADWYNCLSPHSQPLNANQKAYAAWALWTEIASQFVRPVAGDDGPVETDEDVAIEIDVLANDHDPDGVIEPGTVAVLVPPAHGMCAVQGDGTVAYTPDADYFGPDAFSYTVRDNHGATSNPAEVTVTVQPVNDAPLADDDQRVTSSAATVTIAVLDNDSDVDGFLNPQTVTIVAGPTRGTAIVNADGTVDYTPDTDFPGLDTFRYTVQDDRGAVSDQATVSISRVDLAVALAGRWSLNEGSGLTADDSSGNGLPGTLINGPAWIAGWTGGALDFDGVNDYLDIAIALEPTVTISAWARSAGMEPLADMLWSISGGVGFRPALYFHGNVALNCGDGSSNSFDYAYPSDIDQWHLYTTVIAADDTALYVDGTRVGSAEYRDPTGTGLRVATGNQYGWQGAVDEIRVYNRALIQAEIAILAAGNHPPQASEDGATTEEDAVVAIDLLANDGDLDGDRLHVAAIDTTNTRGAVTDNGDGTVVYDPDGQFDWLGHGRSETDSFVYTIGDGYGATDQATVLVEVLGVGESATVVGRHVFYNNSGFDGGRATADEGDDDAIAPDKQALLPGQTATFANYTSYSQGINGIMIDVLHLADPDMLGPLDFQLKVGTDSNPDTWVPGPPPSSVTVRPGAGVGGSDRITITWADYAVLKQWLQVTLLATANTGLPVADVFYFGNAVADAGNSTTDAKVNAIDMLLARNNPHTFLDPAGIDLPYDYNRDTRVNAIDMLLARNNQTHFLNALRLITVPGAKLGVAEDVPMQTCPDREGHPLAATLHSRRKEVESGPSSASDIVLEQAGAQGSEGTETASAKPDWLYEFGQADRRSKARATAESVDQLLAMYWP
ncbi:MAG: tandem-95 repeat protein [Pirellulales bacterium]|nr:tandem-95 repeat protein [Pirellulales bacterium]